MPAAPYGIAATIRPWILIPARGGSKEIARKALRPLAGKPLVRHTVDAMSRTFGSDRVVVSTDDPEIAHVCEGRATIRMRSSDLAEDGTTLDAVALDLARALLEQGAGADDALVTVQPTSPFVTGESVRRALEQLRQSRSVVSVRDDRHLRWTLDADGAAVPLFADRVNRQWLPSTFAETGGIIAARLGDITSRGSRILEPTALFLLAGNEAIDIDSVADWIAAETAAARRRIVIRADAGAQVGMGHVYRTLALASELLGHEVVIVTRSGEGSELGAAFFDRHGYPLRVVGNHLEFLDVLAELRPDMTVLDVLDTEREFVLEVKARGGFVVSFEDLGAGAACADLVINDLYSSRAPAPNQWFGLEVALLAPQFETVAPRSVVAETVQSVLVTFGGTDPNNLTLRALDALAVAGFRGCVTVVLGPGRRDAEIDLESRRLSGRVLRAVDHMALLMRESDVAITSAGRTVTELMSVGVPTVVLCQNRRELWHSHASAQLGVINLGLGAHASAEGIAAHLRLLFDDRQMRADMRQRALAAVDGRSNRVITSRILSAFESARAASL